MIARFQPEAWIDDYAVDVDPDGPDTWTVSPAMAAAIIADDYQDLDYLRDDEAAPAWVRNWTGPFTVYIEEP